MRRELSSIDSLDKDSWNARLAELGGHLLQSWAWGEFKSCHGWEVERIAISGPATPVAMAQVLYRHRGPVSVAYVPRGPAVEPGNSEALRNLLVEIDKSSRRHRALYLLIEPNTALPISGAASALSLERGSNHFQPVRTVKVPLSSDEELLAQMHQKTRYSVRLAQRKDVQVQRHEGFNEAALAGFYRLLAETSERNEFGIHREDYYRSFLTSFGMDSLLLMASTEGQPAAGLIAACFGDEAVYMYGGSSKPHRQYGAAFALQFEAMKWARDRGKSKYDLWGIPEADPVPDDQLTDRVPATRGDDLRGLYRFKTGFGGQIVDYPPTLQRTYRRLATQIARRMIGATS